MKEKIYEQSHLISLKIADTDFLRLGVSHSRCEPLKCDLSCLELAQLLVAHLDQFWKQ